MAPTNFFSNIFEKKYRTCEKECIIVITKRTYNGPPLLEEVQEALDIVSDAFL